MRRLTKTFTILLAAGLRLAESAPAQQAAHPSEPAGERSYLMGEKLSGDRDGLRPKLEKAGITLDATYSHEYLGVVAGGLRRGREYDGLLEFDLHLDLAALTGDRWKERICTRVALPSRRESFGQSGRERGE